MSKLSDKSAVGAAIPRQASLDGLRGIAVTMVMLHHFVGLLTTDVLTRGAVPSAVSRVTSAGWAGVDLFFVLSGFLITRILLETRTSGSYYRAFYARRALRIFPLYYGVLVAVFVIAPLVTGISDAARITHDNQLWIWLYGTNILSGLQGVHLATDAFSINHFWSLAIEEQFYLLWPLLVLHVSPRRLLAVCGALIVVAFAARFGVRYTLGGRAAYLLTPCRWDSLALGAGAALLIQLGWTPARLARYTSPLGLVSLLGIAVIAVIERGLDPTRPLTQLFGYALIEIVALAAIVWCLSREEVGSSPRWLAAGPLAFLGTYSYGIYVFHGIFRLVFAQHIPWLVETVGDPRLACVLFVLVTCAISIAISVLSYHLFEVRFLALKARVPYAPPAAAR